VQIPFVSGEPLLKDHESLELGHLADMRLVSDLRDRSGYIKIPAGNYRIGE
jgi:hypothetical protein